MTDILQKDYVLFFQSLKNDIQSSRIRAVLAVNKELTLLYWRIGSHILLNQEKFGWGSKIIENLSLDLKREFPEIKGFGRANIHYMRKFAADFPDYVFVQEVLGQISWYHNITLLDKVSDPQQRLWYAQMAIQEGWSRNVMVAQIETNLYRRQGKSITNFSQTLPSPRSDNAQNILKDPYVFDFVDVENRRKERLLESSLTEHITKFLLELGAGFAFIGKQVHLEVDGKDYYIDLLFYHLHLRSYIVIELKAGEFKPEHAGKMNFYIGAVDHLFKKHEDNATLGLILCKEKSKITVEWALKELNRPIGVSEFVYTHDLPKELQGVIPSAEELEVEIQQYMTSDDED